MVLFDLLGQRWTMRILWELSDGRLSFRDLRARCDDASPTVLNRRLKQLRDLDLVDLEPQGFGLTTSGRALGRQLVALDRWASAWAAEAGHRPAPAKRA
jgi:DNA-binding HxlR family transcriptional regulator